MYSLSRSRSWVPALLGLALVVLLSPVSFAADPPATFVALRIQSPSDRVLIELPLQLLQYLSAHTKGDLDVGRVGSHDTKFPMADLMKIVQGDQASHREVLFFTARNDKQEPVSFFVRTFTRQVPPGAPKPSSLVFTVKKDGKETVGISVSMDTLASWAKDFGRGDKDKAEDDFAPFVRACLADAQTLGAGPVLRIVGKDGEVVFSLK